MGRIGMDLIQVFFGFRGRIQRSVYWFSVLFLVATNIVYFLFLGAVANQAGGRAVSGHAGGGNSAADFVLGSLFMAGWIGSTWSGLAIQVKRAHDRGYSGVTVLGALVPVVGWAWAIIDLGCLEGAKGNNRFGPPPKQQAHTVALARSAGRVDLQAGGVRGRASNFAAATDPQDDALYAAVAQELEKNDIAQGLWTRLLVENEGDEQKTKISYIKARVRTLKAQRGEAELTPSQVPTTSVPSTPIIVANARPESPAVQQPVTEVSRSSKGGSNIVRPVMMPAPPNLRKKAGDEAKIVDALVIVAVSLIIGLMLFFAFGSHSAGGGS
jgi:uncharacterized membrane protein YhaH (DUF805 family)